MSSVILPHRLLYIYILKRLRMLQYRIIIIIITYKRYLRLCLYILIHIQRVDRLYTSESDVCRRQILTHKDSPALKELNYL